MVFANVNLGDVLDVVFGAHHLSFLPFMTIVTFTFVFQLGKKTFQQLGKKKKNSLMNVRIILRV